VQIQVEVQKNLIEIAVIEGCCPDCIQHPIEVPIEGSTVRLLGCRDHTRHMAQQIKDIRALGGLEVDATEVDRILENFDWLKKLPKRMHLPFRKLAESAGLLAGFYSELRKVLRRRLDKPGGHGEKLN
jgi:hypothetical protein